MGRHSSVTIGTCCVLLIIILNLTCVHSMFTIPLTRSAVSQNKRSTALMSLKLRQSRLSGSSSSPSSSSSSVVGSTTTTLLEEGEVPLSEEVLSEKHLATYFGTISIDGTDFRVLFDTGSCEFWVPSAVCTTSRCMKHHRLPEAQRKLATTTPMNIQYLSGKVQGDMVLEKVVLGDITVKNQVVGVAKVVDIDLLDDVKWDGILGLAYPNPTLSSQGITPIFDTIIRSHVLSSRHLANQFAYYIDDTHGAITFGGANCDFIAKGESKKNCIDKFSFVPVTEKTYWTINIKDVSIKYPHKPAQSGFCPTGGCKAIVDTGTYLIYGPESQVTSMVSSQLRGCGAHKNMPSFTFTFVTDEGQDVDLTLNPIDYILKFDIQSRKECVVGISPDKDTLWTLGQVFLRSFYTVFDRDQNRIGFARIPRRKFRAINAKRGQASLLEEMVDPSSQIDEF
jgi:Eukaryotic aspartyl protease